MRHLRIDLHIHTCLSPCADLTMTPVAIARQAKMRNLDGIGICDHNSSENVPSVKAAGGREGIKVLSGIEITSREEVHIMGFFDCNSDLREVQETVYENLCGENDENRFGEQLIVDEHNRVIGSNKRLLIGATSLAVDEVVCLIHNSGGLAIASHIDRESFSIIGQLGFVPEGLSLDALELSPNCPSREQFAHINYGFPIVKSSDAHFVEDIGKAFTEFVLDEVSVSQIRMAFRGVEGKEIRI